MTTSSVIIQSFTPPGRLKDFTPEQEALWSQKISEMFDNSIKGDSQAKNNSPRPQFFNPTKTNQASDLQEKVISWIGFPKQVRGTHPSDKARWKAADESRHVQDEYCEWNVLRNPEGKITSVTFTCEGPEYWEFLGATNPAKVVELYRTYISEKVEKEDLFDKDGRYIPQNKWNQDTKNGAMHLIQENNTLSAEIELAAGASMVRKKEGRIIDEQQELIRCGKYGAPGRNSDPFIGAEVNSLTRKGAMVSLRDPVGLYFDEFNPLGWETPDGSDPKSYWKILRGDKDTPVRAVYEVPEKLGFTVGDIKINGHKIKYGAQIADSVRIKLVGIAQNIHPSNICSFGCVSDEKPTNSPSLGRSLSGKFDGKSEVDKD